MSTFKRIFIISAICIFYLMECVLAFSKENIIGGSTQGSEVFTCQVLIQGQKNYSNRFDNLGGAAIVTNTYIISASSLFLESNNDLKMYRFSILLGSHDLNHSSIYRRVIGTIYFIRSTLDFLFFNIALAEIPEGIGIGSNPRVNAVRFPNLDEQFTDAVAIVTGFGYYEIERGIDPIFRSPIVTSGNYSSLLRYKNVNILSDDDCADTYSKDEILDKFCGIMPSNYPKQIAGICDGDIGSPLIVAGDMLVGIAFKTTPDCDNTVKGALYLKITSFLSSIQSILRDRYYLGKGFIRYNRVHKENH